MSHNKHLTHYLHQWTEQAQAAKSAADLYAVTAAMTQFGAPKTGTDLFFGSIF